MLLKKSLKVFASVDAHLSCWLIQFQVLTSPLCSHPPPLHPAYHSQFKMASRRLFHVARGLCGLRAAHSNHRFTLARAYCSGKSEVSFVWLQFISCQENNQQIVAYGSLDSTVLTKGLGWIMVRHFLCGFVLLFFSWYLRTSYFIVRRSSSLRVTNQTAVYPMSHSILDTTPPPCPLRGNEVVWNFLTF